MNRSIVILPLMLAACSQGIDQPSAASLEANEQQQIEQQQMLHSVDQLNLSVRLKAAEARIVTLERQVGALEATPQAIENQLLTQRIERLEARVYATAPDGDAPTPPTGPVPREAPSREATPAPAPVPAPGPSPAARFNPFGL